MSGTKEGRKRMKRRRGRRRRRRRRRNDEEDGGGGGGRGRGGGGGGGGGGTGRGILSIRGQLRPPVDEKGEGAPLGRLHCGFKGHPSTVLVGAMCCVFQNVCKPSSGASVGPTFLFLLHHSLAPQPSPSPPPYPPPPPSVPMDPIARTFPSHLVTPYIF